MTDLAEIAALPNPTDALPDRDAWEQRMEQATEESGYFHSVGDAHWAYFADEGTTLLVSFETVDAVLARPDQMPLANSLARAHGWSALTIIADWKARGGFTSRITAEWSPRRRRRPARA